MVFTIFTNGSSHSSPAQFLKHSFPLLAKRCTRYEACLFQKVWHLTINGSHQSTTLLILKRKSITWDNNAYYNNISLVQEILVKKAKFIIYFLPAFLPLLEINMSISLTFEFMKYKSFHVKWTKAGHDPSQIWWNFSRWKVYMI